MRFGDRECDVINACVLELAVCLPLYEDDLFEILQVLDTFHETRPSPFQFPHATAADQRRTGTAH